VTTPGAMPDRNPDPTKSETQTMDREVLRMMAHIDQTRAEVRSAVEKMPPDDLVELFRDCAAGRLADMDDQTLVLVGMLAAMAIYDICQARAAADIE
jgi:hypothetical protein